LSDVYKTLVQTVPAAAKTAEVDDIVTFLGAIVRATDSSLLDEWEGMQRGAGAPVESVRDDSVLTTADRVDITRDEKAFTVLVRNRLFSVLRLLGRQDWEGAAAALQGDEGPVTAERMAQAFAPFYEEHRAVRLDPGARAATHTRIVAKDEACWHVEQVICDPEDANDWALFCRVDLEASRSAGHPVLVLDRIGT